MHSKEHPTKQDYYWSEIGLAFQFRNLKRIRECYFALKALNGGKDHDALFFPNVQLPEIE